MTPAERRVLQAALRLAAADKHYHDAAPCTAARNERGDARYQAIPVLIDAANALPKGRKKR